MRVRILHQTCLALSIARSLSLSLPGLSLRSRELNCSGTGLAHTHSAATAAYLRTVLELFKSTAAAHARYVSDAARQFITGTRHGHTFLAPKSVADQQPLDSVSDACLRAAFWRQTRRRLHNCRSADRFLAPNERRLCRRDTRKKVGIAQRYLVTNHARQQNYCVCRANQAGVLAPKTCAIGPLCDKCQHDRELDRNRNYISFPSRAFGAKMARRTFFKCSRRRQLELANYATLASNASV